MQPLIDGDLLTYELAYGCQHKVGDEIIPISLEDVNRRVKEKVDYICSEVWATEPPLLYFTGKHNFRLQIAKKKVYKGQRKKEKPFHWKYIRALLKASYESYEDDQLEADDLLCIEQTSRLSQRDTIICTRDKDLKMCEGFHYTWEVSKQPAWGPKWVDKLGETWLVGRKLKATGARLFYSQMLMGDSVDNIGGVAWWGPEKAYEALSECTTVQELHDTVVSVYREVYGEGYETYMKEQGNLLWMVRRLKDDGAPMIWEDELTSPEYFK